MERDWIVGIFALAGVLVGAVLSYMLRRAERKDERGYVERKRTIDRLEELHFEIAELMSKCTNFGIDIHKILDSSVPLNERSGEAARMNNELQPLIAKISSMRRLYAKSLDKEWGVTFDEIEKLRQAAGQRILGRIDQDTFKQHIELVHKRGTVFQAGIEGLLDELASHGY